MSVLGKVSRMASQVPKMFLPPANEVCEGYVFTGACLSTGGLCPKGSLTRGVSVQRGGGLCLGGLCPERRGSLSGGSLSREEGVSVWGVSVQRGGGLCLGGLCPGGSLSGRPHIRLRADGRHPTGMHSCLENRFLKTENVDHFTSR